MMSKVRNKNMKNFLVLACVIYIIFLIGCEDSTSSTGGSGTTPVAPSVVTLSNVQIRPSSNDGTLELKWDASAEATQVLVVATASGQPSIQVRVPSVEYQSLFQRGQSFMLKGLRSVTQYTITLEAQKSGSESSKVVQQVVTQRDTTKPQDELMQVAIKKIDDGIQLTWDAEQLKAGLTDIAQATIRIKESSTDKMIKEVVISDVSQGTSDISVLTVEGMHYDVEVIHEDINGNVSTAKKVLSDIDIANVVKTVTALTEKDLVMEAKDKNKNIADESLLIQWGSFDFSSGKQLSVRVSEVLTKAVVLDTKVSSSSDATLTTATAKSNGYSTFYVAKDGIALTKLYGTQEYRVQVAVFKNGVYSTTVEKLQKTTDKITEPVLRLSATGGENNIIVGWEAPQAKDYAGVIISVKEKGTSRNVAGTPLQITDVTVRTAEVAGLTIDTFYTVSVQSVDKAGNKSTIEAVHDIRTKRDRIAPDTVSNVVVTYSFTPSKPTVVTAYIRWDAPDVSKENNKDIKEYNIVIRQERARDVYTGTIVYPKAELNVDLEASYDHEIYISAEDYAGNESDIKRIAILTPSLRAPQKDIVTRIQSVVTAAGQIQIQASFKEAPGTGKYYTLHMYDGTTLVSKKSITKTDTSITFGIADGLEIPKTKVTEKKYGFTLTAITQGIISSATDLTPTESDKIAVYDAVSTAPPAPQNAALHVLSTTQATGVAQYEFSVGTFSNKNKAPNGKQLTQAQAQYRVYIVEGDHSTKTLEDIKTLAGVSIQTVAGKNSVTKHTVDFIGKKGAAYTVAVEAINSLSPYYTVAGVKNTIKTVVIQASPTTPKATTYSTNDAVVFSVPDSGGNAGKKVITVQVNASDVTGVSKADKTALAETDLAYYVVYVKKQDTSKKPENVSVLWGLKKSSLKVVKYAKATGTKNATISIEIVDSTSNRGTGLTPIETAKNYYIGVRVVNTTSPEYDASDSTKIFPPGYYRDIAEIKEVYSSMAEAPQQSLLTGKLAVSPSTTTGAVKLVLTELNTFTGAKNYDGKAIANNTQLVYTVYGLQKDTTPTVAEVLAGRRVALGTASASGVYTVASLVSLGLSSDSVSPIAMKGDTQYHFVVEVAIKADLSKKAYALAVASVTTASKASAPSEVSGITVKVAEKGMAVSWKAPVLDNNNVASTGDPLTVAEVSYKVYSVAKNGSTQRTVAQIKASATSTKTVVAGTTHTVLTGTVGTYYEIVVQAINSTDDTKVSAGLRSEFQAQAKNPYAAPSSPTIQARETMENGNTINVSIVAPNVKGTTADGFTELKDDQIGYTIYYYASSQIGVDAATVKAQAKGASDIKIGAVKDDVPLGAKHYIIKGLDFSTQYYITVEAVNSLNKTKVSPLSAVSRVVTASFSMNISTSNITATVGTAINDIPFTVLPADATYSCSGTLINNLQRETGLQVSLKNKLVNAITGMPNKSNVHDPTITNYSYELHCRGTGSEHTGRVSLTIVVETDLQRIQGESAKYYRPTTKASLRDIIYREAYVIQEKADPDLNMIDTSAITTMEGLFEFQSQFNGHMSHWNTSNVMNMNNMFSHAIVFNQDIGNWDVGKVTSMTGMFINAKAFNQDIGDWNVENVASMSSMFTRASAFNQDIGNWDVENVANMDNMFEEASAFNQDIGDWDVKNVESMAGMFYKASVFNNASNTNDIGSWNVEKVTSMSSMFEEASAFNRDIGSWKVKKVTDMRSMFAKATAFNQDIGSWKVNEVIFMSSMFSGASVFNQDIGSWNVEKVENMESMFEDARVFDQDLSSWKACSVFNKNNQFKNSGMDGDTAKYPKFSASSECTS